MDKIKTICNFINKKTNKFKPDIAIILGSGLGNVFDYKILKLKDSKIKSSNLQIFKFSNCIEYSDIPGFTETTIKGHQGKLIFGKVNRKKVMVMQGRFHFYEGYSAKEIAMPVRVMKELGVKKLIVTNAAGAVNKDFSVGQLLLISDQINLTGVNPLRGANQEKLGVRFPDMSDCYDKKLRKIILKAAFTKKLNLREGVYMYFCGPNYETKAEIRAARVLGADIIGMSTVPEVIAAVHCGIKVIGVSCVTNMAAGILNRPLSHDEVIETTASVKDNFKSLIKLIISNI